MCSLLLKDLSFNFIYISDYEYTPPEDERSNTDQNRSGTGFKRFTKTRIFERSSKPRGPQQNFTHPTGRTNTSRVLDFSIPTTNKFEMLQDNENPNLSWRDRDETSRKHKANSPLDSDKDLKKYCERDSPNPGCESKNGHGDMQIDSHPSPPADLPLDEGRTIPQTPIIAVHMQRDNVANITTALDPENGATSGIGDPNTTNTQNSNTRA